MRYRQTLNTLSGRGHKSSLLLECLETRAGGVGPAGGPNLPPKRKGSHLGPSSPNQVVRRPHPF